MNPQEDRCVETHRLQAIDDRHEEIREDVKEIREGFLGLTKEIHLMGVSFVANSEVLKGIMLRFEDRDKIIQDVVITNRATFNRFSDKIDAIDNRLRGVETVEHKISTIERVLWSLVAGIGALVLFYIQQRMH